MVYFLVVQRSLLILLKNSSDAIKIAVGTAEMSGIASKQSVGVGILAGDADLSFLLISQKHQQEQD